MRISDLQKYLAAVKRRHGDLEVIEQRYSDYGPMEPIPTETAITTNEFADEVPWAVVSVASQQGGAFKMRRHFSVSDDEAERMGFKPMLLYKGN